MPAPQPWYVPVLKARTAELDALRTLPVAASGVLPLFEAQAVLPPARNTKTGDWIKRKSASSEVATFLDEVALAWTAPMMVDIARAAGPTTRAAWWTLLQSLEAIRPTGATLIPVVHLNDPAAALSAAAPLATKAKHAAVRVTMPTNPATLGSGLPAVASQLHVPLDNLIVLLDWGTGLELSTIALDDAERETRLAIAALPAGHGPIVTLGTPDTSPAQQAGYWQFTRREWWLWLRLRLTAPELWFGDYALFAGGNPVPRSPNYAYLRYSADDVLHIWREAPPATGGGKGGAYKVCCEKVVADPAFAGPAFSPADKHIDDIATGTVASDGRPQVWRADALGHHLHLVRSQLASPPPAPPVGTP